MVISLNMPGSFKLFLIIQISISILNSNPANPTTIDNQGKPMPLTTSNNSAFVEISQFKKSCTTLEKEADRKSLADFGDFLQNTRYFYFTLWRIRMPQVIMLDNNRKGDRDNANIGTLLSGQGHNRFSVVEHWLSAFRLY